MTDPRKASDILLGLETEVQSLKRIINLQDHLLKTILGNCNKTNAILFALIDAQPLTQEQKAIIKNQFQPKETAIEVVNISPGFPIEVEKEFKGQRRITKGTNAQPSTKASNVDIDFKDYMAQRIKPAKQPEFQAPAPEKTNKSEKKIPVVQRVQDNNNKDLFMAEINLSSVTGEHLLKTKTNAMGKWQAQLSPGNYIVKVSKMDTALQKRLEAQQDITVPNVNSTVTLSTLIVNRDLK